MLEELIGTKTKKGFFEYSYAIGFGPDFRVSGSIAEKTLNSMAKTRAPIVADTADDIIEAFNSIASAISSISQTANGKLIIDGESFDAAVDENRALPIAVYANNGSELLFVITCPTDEEVTWKDGITVSEHEYSDTNLIIDMSGLAFAGKNGLSVQFNYKNDY